MRVRESYAYWFIALVLTVWAAPAAAQDSKDVEALLKEANQHAENEEFDKAAPLMKKACDLGSEIGCAALGTLYVSGKGVDKDLDRGVDFLQRGCPADARPDSTGCNFALAAAMLLITGAEAEIEKSVPHGNAIFDYVCDTGSLQLCSTLIFIYRTGSKEVGLEANKTRALELAQKGCKRGDDDICSTRDSLQFDVKRERIKKQTAEALKYYEAGDFSAAAPLLTKVCEEDPGKACVKLAHLYANGKGVEEDDARARKLYLRACDKYTYIGEACGALSDMYAKGEGGPKDAQKAKEYNLTACRHDQTDRCRNLCQKGDGAGCASLADAYMRGENVAKDFKRGLSLLDKACTLGDEDACKGLGYRYMKGDGVAKEMGRAIAYYKKACRAGHTTSCGYVGQFYAEGKGVPRNLVEAISWYNKLCSQGSTGQRVCDYQTRRWKLEYNNKGHELLEAGRTSAAINLLEQACMADVEHSCGTLGSHYFDRKSYSKAAKYFALGCEAGSALSCVNAGYMYQEGLAPGGVDRYEARRFYKKGCNLGDNDGCRSARNMSR